MAKLIHVVPTKNHTLVIGLDNSHKIIYDMKPRLQTARFCELAELDRFKAVTIEDGSSLVWTGLCQITIDEIIRGLEK